MIWKKFPHIAPEGAKVFVYYKSYDDPYRDKIQLPMVPLTVGPSQQWSHILKWCYQDELDEENIRLLKEKIK